MPTSAPRSTTSRASRTGASPSCAPRRARSSRSSASSLSEEVSRHESRLVDREERASRLLPVAGRVHLSGRVPGGEPLHLFLGGGLLQSQHRRHSAALLVAADPARLPLLGADDAALERGTK